MPDLKRLVHGLVKRWKDWLPRVALGFVGFAALFYIGTVIWRTIQEVDLNTLPALLVICVVYILMLGCAWSYWRVVFAAVVGMVIGAVAGFFPYLVIAIIMMLLELSPEGQVTSRELSQLFNNDVFLELFFVAGAASGGPIAVYAYHERKKEDAEKDKRSVTCSPQHGLTGVSKKGKAKKEMQL